MEDCPGCGRGSAMLAWSSNSCPTIRIHACCAAQMFLSEGDGVVFRGANGAWQTEDKEFHLSDLAAGKLIKTVLDRYRTRFGVYPKELFIHGRTKFNDSEWDAFSKAAPERQRRRGPYPLDSWRDEALPRWRLSMPRRHGNPTRRYRCLSVDHGICATHRHLYRPGTPNPLFVTVLRASGEFPAIDVVLADILGLTRSTTIPATSATGFRSPFVSRTRSAKC